MRDMMRECNTENQNVADFTTFWCARCISPECTRSRAKALSFNQRTATWEDRLFNQVARLDPSDPRYLPIAGQNFVELPVGERGAPPSAWVDPQEAPTKPTITPVPEKGAPRLVVPRHLALSNAPDQTGRVFGPSGGAVPKADPWAAPAPLGSTEKVIPVGGKIRLT